MRHRFLPPEAFHDPLMSQQEWVLHELYQDSRIDVHQLLPDRHTSVRLNEEPIASAEDMIGTNATHHLHGVIQHEGDVYGIVVSESEGRAPTAFVTRAARNAQDRSCVIGIFDGAQPLSIGHDPQSGSYAAELTRHEVIDAETGKRAVMIGVKAHKSDVYIGVLPRSHNESGNDAVRMRSVATNVIGALKRVLIREQPEERTYSENLAWVASEYEVAAARDELRLKKDGERIASSTPDLRRIVDIKQDDSTASSGSPEEFARSVVTFLRSHRSAMLQTVTEPPGGRYTEIHTDTDSGRPIIVVAPRPMYPGGASLHGNHSIIDEVRLNDVGEYPRFEAFVNDPARMLGGETRDGKGYTTLLPDGRMRLIIHTSRTGRPQRAPLWLDELARRAKDFGYDGGVAYAPELRSEPQEIDSEKDIRYRPRVIADILAVPEDKRSQHSISGVVAKIDMKDVGWRAGPDGQKMRREQDIILHTLESPTHTHEMVLAALEKQTGKDRRTAQQIQADGRPVDVSIRYTLDSQHNTVSINLFYGGAEAPHALKHQIVRALGRSLIERYDLSDVIQSANVVWASESSLLPKRSAIRLKQQ